MGGNRETEKSREVDRHTSKNTHSSEQAPLSVQNTFIPTLYNIAAH
jgi:hypothetical protein